MIARSPSASLPIRPFDLPAFAIATGRRWSRKSISANATFTFDRTPPPGTMFGLALINTSAAARTVNVPSSFAVGTQETLAAFSIAAYGRELLTWWYDGTTYWLTGSPPAVAGGGGAASFSDNFNRSNESPIAGNWEPTSDPHSVTLIGNRIVGTGSGGYARVKSSAAAFAATQEASLVIQSGSENFAGPAVLLDASFNGYTVGQWGANDIRVMKLSGFTQVGTSIAATVAAGDVLKLRAVGGGVLEVFKNGVSIGARTDASSPWTSGQPGVWVSGSIYADDFVAADV